MHRAPRAVAGALTASALLIGLLTPTALAGGGATIRVDDDGTVGSSSCDGSIAAPKALQPAVDAASPGDTIIVCPGSYPGLVTVTTDDLTIRGSTSWPATLRPGPLDLTPAGGGGPSFGPAILTVQGAKDVHIQWLRFTASATQSVPPGPCGVGAMIRLVHARNAVIRGNRMRPNGPNTLTCGYIDGIQVLQGSSAWVGFNAVRDFKGEAVTATSSSMTAYRNSIRYWHTGAGGPTLTGSPAPGCLYGAGVVFADGATGSAIKNRISGVAAALTGGAPLMCPGIYTPGAGDGVTIKQNRIRYVFDGINTADLNNGLVTGNVILDSGYDGLRVGSAGQTVFKDNVVRRTGLDGIAVDGDGPVSATYGRHSVDVAGISAPGGNTFKGNLARGGGDLDCYDGSSGSGTLLTNNTWVANVSGGNDSPDGSAPPADRPPQATGRADRHGEAIPTGPRRSRPAAR